MFAVGIMDNVQTGNLTFEPYLFPAYYYSTDVTSAEHAELARILSESATVLLKNDGGASENFLCILNFYHSFYLWTTTSSVALQLLGVQHKIVPFMKVKDLDM